MSFEQTTRGHVFFFLFLSKDVSRKPYRELHRIHSITALVAQGRWVEVRQSHNLRFCEFRVTFVFFRWPYVDDLRIATGNEICFLFIKTCAVPIILCDGETCVEEDLPFLLQRLIAAHRIVLCPETGYTEFIKLARSTQINTPRTHQ